MQETNKSNKINKRQPIIAILCKGIHIYLSTELHSYMLYNFMYLENNEFFELTPFEDNKTQFPSFYNLFMKKVLNGIRIKIIYS